MEVDGDGERGGAADPGRREAEGRGCWDLAKGKPTTAAANDASARRCRSRRGAGDGRKQRRQAGRRWWTRGVMSGGGAGPCEAGEVQGAGIRRGGPSGLDPGDGSSGVGLGDGGFLLAAPARTYLGERESMRGKDNRRRKGKEGEARAWLAWIWQRTGRCLLALLLITGGDGWLDPLGVEVSASAGGGRWGGGRSWLRAGGFGSRLPIGDWFGAETKGESGGGGHGMDGTDP